MSFDRVKPFAEAITGAHMAPEEVAADAEAACTGACSLDRCVVDHLERMRTRLERFLRIQGLL
jgi:hypothetical protein